VKVLLGVNVMLGVSVIEGVNVIEGVSVIVGVRVIVGDPGGASAAPTTKMGSVVALSMTAA
jgi:hypothetical protein